jgi:hypothetical protein
MSTIAEDALSALTAGAKGAAAGMALGPVGAGVGGALGIAMSLLPGAAHLLGASDATAAKVVQTVQAVTGTSDPAAQAIAATDPQIAADLRVQLAQIAADQQAAQLADVASARQQTVQLAQAGSSMAWGTPVVSTLVLGSFALMCGIVLFRAIPEGSMALAQGLLEVLKILSVTVVAYWCGSSAGSSRKTELLAAGTPAAPEPNLASESQR